MSSENNQEFITFQGVVKPMCERIEKTVESILNSVASRLRNVDERYQAILIIVKASEYLDDEQLKPKMTYLRGYFGQMTAIQSQLLDLEKELSLIEDWNSQNFTNENKEKITPYLIRCAEHLDRKVTVFLQSPSDILTQIEGVLSGEFTISM